MGNRSSISIHNHPSGAGPARVVLWDGTVLHFDDPVTAAELMMDHPQQVVVEFDPSTMSTSKRPTPLPADCMLDVRKVYLMLPVKGGKPASLSSEAARRVLSSASAVLGTRSLLPSTNSRFLLLLAGMCTARAQANEEVIHRKDVCTKLEDLKATTVTDMGYTGGPEYLSRQISGKGWKPSLDTIVEKKVKNKAYRRLLSAHI
ncbi:hypothetical protein MLD38_040031 [Melastoma candidum]|uniref:Uncharacterized protein n=1 Tax=Melastoma candidum TaxID=119954 RepID=A0ACB9L4W9_9MYRT|nr:hypothetical protein MLD38_040031 [Melastoma candidum]